MIRLRGGAPRRALPGRVRERISALGTLLRIFAEEGDHLLTPAAVPPLCVRPVAGVVEPALEVERDRPNGDAIRLAWCHVNASSAECNGRAFAFALADQLGQLLPGSQILRSLEGAREARFPEAPWVFKAALSVAGRDRVRGSGGQPSVDQARRIGRLIEEQGAGVLEPWVDRVADFGYGSQEGLHAIEGTIGGTFQGVRWPAPRMDSSERRAIEVAREAVASALQTRHHRGPWGVDAWRYRRQDGSLALWPLGEINARMTFGHVARAWFERVGVPRWGLGTSMALRFGERPESNSKNIISLVGAANEPISYAWLERLKPPAS